MCRCSLAPTLRYGRASCTLRHCAAVHGQPLPGSARCSRMRLTPPHCSCTHVVAGAPAGAALPARLLRAQRRGAGKLLRSRSCHAVLEVGYPAAPSSPAAAPATRWPAGHAHSSSAVPSPPARAPQPGPPPALQLAMRQLEVRLHRAAGGAVALSLPLGEAVGSPENPSHRPPSNHAHRIHLVAAALRCASWRSWRST